MGEKYETGLARGREAKKYYNARQWCGELGHNSTHHHGKTQQARAKQGK